ncbi:MAG: transporter substrate-binding domain-containing protein [Clostridia bacterium]|nr:transporter substrate-binding domain-containing protein [Clostridia bacterium]
MILTNNMRKRWIAFAIIIAFAVAMVPLWTVDSHAKAEDVDMAKVEEQFNEYLAKISKNGEQDDIYDKWFTTGTIEPLDYEGLTAENGTLTFGCRDNKPFAYMDQGQYGGYTVDMVYRFCKEYGYGMKLKSFSDNNSLVMGVVNDKIDFGGASISITEEREKIVDFSDPYFDNLSILIVRGEDVDKYKDESDFAGKRIGIVTGTAFQYIVPDCIDNPELFQYNDETAMLLALESGKIDAAADDSAIFEFEHLTFTSLEMGISIDQGDQYGIVFPKTEEKAGFFAGIKNSFERTFIQDARWKMFISGILVTMLITLLSIILGTALGFVAYLAERKGNRVALAINRFLSWLISGMPVVVLLMIMYYIVFGSMDISGTIVSIIAFTLVFAAAVLSVLKNAIGTVDIGQYEAAYTLGYSDIQTFFSIILPQAMSAFFTPYKAEIVSLIKATAVVGYIAVQDLTKIGDIVRSTTYEAFFPLIATAVIYFVLAAVLTHIVKRIEIKTNPESKDKTKILKGVEEHD